MTKYKEEAEKFLKLVTAGKNAKVVLNSDDGILSFTKLLSELGLQFSRESIDKINDPVLKDNLLVMLASTISCAAVGVILGSPFGPIGASVGGIAGAGVGMAIGFTLVNIAVTRSAAGQLIMSVAKA